MFYRIMNSSKTLFIFSILVKFRVLRGGGGGQAYHFGKKYFELGVRGEGQDTSPNLWGSFESIRAILPM